MIRVLGKHFLEHYSRPWGVIVPDSDFRCNDWHGVKHLPSLAPVNKIEVVYLTASFPIRGREEIYKKLNILKETCVDLY